MSLAHLAGQPVVHRPGKRVALTGTWTDELHRPTEPEAPDPPEVPASVMVAGLCEEMRTGITSDIIARIVGIHMKAASGYLCVLRDRGVIEVERVIRHSNGRPTNVYRMRGAR